MEVTGTTQPKTVYEPRQIDEKSERVGVVKEAARLGRTPALRGLDDKYVARRAVDRLVAHLSKLYSSVV